MSEIEKRVEYVWQTGCLSNVDNGDLRYYDIHGGEGAKVEDPKALCEALCDYNGWDMGERIDESEARKKCASELLQLIDKEHAKGLVPTRSSVEFILERWGL
jgi:hypothetical protein